jgi:hypothetical protein
MGLMAKMKQWMEQSDEESEYQASSSVATPARAFSGKRKVALVVLEPASSGAHPSRKQLLSPARHLSLPPHHSVAIARVPTLNVGAEEVG